MGVWCAIEPDCHCVVSENFGRATGALGLCTLTLAVLAVLVLIGIKVESVRAGFGFPAFLITGGSLVLIICVIVCACRTFRSEPAQTITA